MSEAGNIVLSLRTVAEHEDLTGASFDIVNEAAITNGAPNWVVDTFGRFLKELRASESDDRTKVAG